MAKKKAKTKPKGLTVLQKRFCDILHTMKKPNQGRAYQLAGSNCKDSAADTIAAECLGKPHVKKYFKSLQKKSTERALKTKDEIIKQAENLAFSDFGDYVKVDKNGVSLKDWSELTKAQRACITQAEERTTLQGSVSKFKLHGKEKALELLMRYHKMFGDMDDAAETFAEALHKAMMEGK